MKDLATKLSEYETCDSSDAEDTTGQVTTDNEGAQSMNERKRNWRNKRKKSGLPTANSFLKKPNTNTTPPKTNN